MSGSRNYKEVEKRTLTLYNNYKGKIHTTKDTHTGLTRLFTLQLKTLQGTLLDPLDLKLFKDLLLRLHLYRVSKSDDTREVFYYFSPTMFHKYDPRCIDCDRVLDHFNTGSDKKHCNDCEKDSL